MGEGEGEGEGESKDEGKGEGRVVPGIFLYKCVTPPLPNKQEGPRGAHLQGKGFGPFDVGGMARAGEPEHMSCICSEFAQKQVALNHLPLSAAFKLCAQVRQLPDFMQACRDRKKK